VSAWDRVDGFRPPDLSCTNSTQRYPVDAEHQPTDLAVGVQLPPNGGKGEQRWPRRRLIGELDRYAAATGEDVTVVFDHRPPDVPPGAHGAAVVAFASRRGRDAADHEIVRMLAEDRTPGSFRVVTSDRRLVERTRQLGAGVRSSTSFRHRMDEVLARAATEGR
jgi:YacP-like NYN domain